MTQESGHGRQIALAEVTVGMRFATDVTDEKGLRLVSAGTDVTERLLEQLARHGICEVSVVAPMSEEERRAAREDMTQRLEHRFSLVKDDPLMAELYRLILNYRIKDL